MTHKIVYPFTAIIGQDLMKKALILNTINPKIGGVLIRGTKGTAKSTAVRALTDLLPEIEYITSCPFNCNPNDLKEMCHTCQERFKEGKFDDNDIDTKKMRVITLPLNATEDRVVGTIDINKALTEGLKALEPGILAEAHRSILYIDEVNLLSDNVADVLLDSAAMGLNIIEREGISFHHPANFILVGTMNPEEGNLRPQLLDRFGLSVDVEKIVDIEQRVKIVKNVEEFQANPKKFQNKFQDLQFNLSNKILDAKKLLNKVQISDELLKKIAKICVLFQTDGHRADITIARTAKTLAAYEGREEVSEQDIKTAAKLALNHRLRRLPFEDQTVNEDEIEDMFDKQENEDISDLDDNIREKQEEKKLNNVKEEIFEIDPSVNAGELIKNKRRRELMNTSGQRVLHPTDSTKGKYIGGKKPRNLNFSNSHDIAISETLNKAALELENRDAIKNGKKLQIKDDNIQLKKRIGKSSYLIIFCVDASGSMGVNNRMKMVKGAIFSILQSNYIYRDKVSLIIFRKDKAQLVLPPTRSTDLAYKLLKEIPTGGTTPLVAGLNRAIYVALEENRKKSGYIPLIILLTDARGNIFVNDAIEDVIKTGEFIAKNCIDMIIIDTEASDMKLELGKKLSESSNAVYYHLDHLNRDNLNQILTIEGILDKI
jgi:magnesium chelatase subunit D